MMRAVFSVAAKPHVSMDQGQTHWHSSCKIFPLIEVGFGQIRDNWDGKEWNVLNEVDQTY